MELSTPIVLLVYRRPEETRRVLSAIQGASARKIFVFGDGPRDQAERPLVDAVRAVVDGFTSGPSPLEVEFAAENMGCRRRVVTALDKVFANEPRAIILEDDCLPSADFFRFCDELLERYAGDERVMAINGFMPEPRPLAESYFFSCHSLPWGWATWHRAWEVYDRNLDALAAGAESAWPLTKQGGVGAQYFRQSLHDTKSGVIDTWDFQWMFTVWIHGGVVARPRVNLIQNIGFGPGALHTTDPRHPLADAVASSLSWPLVHPRWILRDYEHDLDIPRLLFPWLESKPRRLLAAIRRRISNTGPFRR